MKDNTTKILNVLSTLESLPLEESFKTDLIDLLNEYKNSLTKSTKAKKVLTDIKIDTDIAIFTDGGCQDNGLQNNRGAWAFVVVEDDKVIEKQSQLCRNTTNNRMELTAAIQALVYAKNNLDKNKTLTVISDSTYVVKGISSWIKNWNLSDDTVTNVDLWRVLNSLNDEINPEWLWCKGHSGVRYNEMCDELCLLSISE